jgi:AraC-like DNA-binding protein
MDHIVRLEKRRHKRPQIAYAEFGRTVARLMKPFNYSGYDEPDAVIELAYRQFNASAILSIGHHQAQFLRVPAMGDTYAVHVLRHGQMELSIDGRTRAVGRGFGVLVQPYHDFDCLFSADCDFDLLRVDRRLVERRLQEHGLEGRLPSDKPMIFDLSEEAGASLALCSTYLTNEVISSFGRNAGSPGALQSRDSDLIVDGLLGNHFAQCMAALTTRRAHRPLAETPFDRRSFAEAYVERHLEQPITVARLAKACGVSSRSLQKDFQQRHGVGPKTFLLNKRLDAAHQDLSSATAGCASVTEVAARWGFEHFGRFSARYRKRFGQLPSTTLRLRS